MSQTTGPWPDSDDLDEARREPGRRFGTAARALILAAQCHRCTAEDCVICAVLRHGIAAVFAAVPEGGAR